MTNFTIPFLDLPPVQNVIKSSVELESVDSTLFFMTHAVTLTSRYEMPIVQGYDGVLPTDIRGLHRTNYTTPVTVAPHFYFDDDRNRNFFIKPYKTEERLSRFGVSISMDFSMTTEMGRPQKMYSSFLNKLWAAWLQSRGHNVIANVSFPDEIEQDYWLDGWPKQSIIAVSSVGVLTHGNADTWLGGMDRIRKELQPTYVLRYGPKIAGENTENCIYFDNDNNRSAYGR